jgi:uncharacterized small protein (DUF1192 family)
MDSVKEIENRMEIYSKNISEIIAECMRKKQQPVPVRKKRRLTKE